jgi:hypothetical protein
MGDWNPVRDSLFDWVERTLTRENPSLRSQVFGPNATSALIESGYVSLFLDGLDEMEVSSRQRAVEQILEAGLPLSMVVTSRRLELAAVKAKLLASTNPVATIELRPIRAPAAAKYLAGLGGVARRADWARLGEYLQQNPGSGVANALNNPLNLTLLRSAYIDQDPNLLLRLNLPTTQAVTDHLIKELLILAFPDPNIRHGSVDALRWLARNLGPLRDLAWWQVARWIPYTRLIFMRAVIASVFAGLVVGLLTGISFGYYYENTAFGLAVGGGAAAVSALVAGILAIFGGLVFARPGGEPRYVALRIPRPPEIPGLVAFSILGGFFMSIGVIAFLLLGLSLAQMVYQGMGGFVGNVTFMEVIECKDCVVALLPTGFILAFMMSLVRIWTVPPAATPTLTPLSSYRADRLASVVYAMSVALAFGIAGAFSYGLGPSEPNGVLVGVAAAICFALVGGVLSLLIFSQSALLALALSIRVVPRRARQLMPFCENMVKKQVLRQAGPIYQFRHAALQDYLARD